MPVGDRARLTPDKSAIISAGTGMRVSFAETNDQSSKLAQLFYARGLRRGDHVAVLMENNLNLVAPV